MVDAAKSSLADYNLKTMKFGLTQSKTRGFNFARIAKVKSTPKFPNLLLTNGEAKEKSQSEQRFHFVTRRWETLELTGVEQLRRPHLRAVKQREKDRANLLTPSSSARQELVVNW